MVLCLLFFKQMTAYEMRISDWSSDVCSSDLPRVLGPAMADSLTGFYAAYGILGALHERHATGVGRKVEVSMFEAMTHFNLDAFQHLFSANEVDRKSTRLNSIH